MRVLVCGGRDFTNFDTVNAELSKLEGIEVIIHGCARGADRLAGQWAKLRGVFVLPFPADWNRYGSSAGPIRNTQMLVEGKPDLVVAFPGRSGTVDMVKQARRAGVLVIEVTT